MRGKAFVFALLNVSFLKTLKLNKTMTYTRNKEIRAKIAVTEAKRRFLLARNCVVVAPKDATLFQKINHHKAWREFRRAAGAFTDVIVSKPITPMWFIDYYRNDSCEAQGQYNDFESAINKLKELHVRVCKERADVDWHGAGYYGYFGSGDFWQIAPCIENIKPEDTGMVWEAYYEDGHILRLTTPEYEL